MGYDAAGAVPKDDVPELQGFCLSRAFGTDYLTGTSRKEETRDKEVDGVVDSARLWSAGGSKAMQVTEELRGDGALSIWWVAYVVEGFEEGREGGEQPGAIREVKGAAFEIVPKRRSQMACGSSDSRASQGLLTCSKKAS